VKEQPYQDVTYAEIDLDALLHNVSVLKKYAKDAKLVAVIKANAYGHGIVKVANKLQESPHIYAIGVARLSEALVLRKAGIQTPIILLEGFFHPEDLPLLAEYNLQSVVHSQEQLKALTDSDITEKLTVWFKIDSGMHRLGFHPSEFSDALTKLKNIQQVQQPIHFMTHFSCADELNNPTTKEQVSLFKSLTAEQPGLCTLASSAGTLAWPESHADVVRPGVALYGISPIANEVGEDRQLKPVMTLKSELIAIRRHSANQPVGYGAIWASPKETRLGVIAFGYGDGYPRSAPAGTPVLINGRYVPIVGRVSMDMITVELGEDTMDKVGDEVILWGKGLPAETVARHVDTIPYTLITNLTNRVHLRYR